MTRFDIRAAKRIIERFDAVPREEWIRRFVYDYGPSDTKLSRDIDEQLPGDERHEIIFEGRAYQVVINRRLERITLQEREFLPIEEDLAA